MTDVQKYLAQSQQTGIVWSIEDVQEVRPDLANAQAWEALQLVERCHDANIGVSWDTVAMAAQTLFGDPTKNKQRR